MNSMSKNGVRTAATILLFGALTLGGCGSDDVAGVNDCDVITTVANIKDTYVVGEVSTNIVVTYTTRNPSASCATSIAKKSVKFASSASDVVSITPTGQIVAIAPGVATVTFGVDTKEPFTKTIHVVAAQLSERH